MDLLSTMRQCALKPMDQNLIMQVHKFSVVMSLIFDKKSKIFTKAIVQNNILRPYRFKNLDFH